MAATRSTLFYQWQARGQAQEEALHETLRDMLLTYRGLAPITLSHHFKRPTSART